MAILACLAIGMAAVPSCGRNGKGGNDAATATKTAGAPIKADSLPIRIDAADGHGIAAIIKEPRRTAEVEFAAGVYNVLLGTITAPEEANVRFNTLTMPDGTSDGPFGRTIEHILPQKGTYRLSIGENLMMGEPWGGEFTLDIRLGHTIPYVEGEHYFVRNDYTADRLADNVITSQAQFDAIFGRAAVMGNMPTPVDFSRQYVIAIIEPMTDHAVRYQAESLVEMGGKAVLTVTRTDDGPRQYSVRPMLMVVADGKYPGEISIVER